MPTNADQIACPYGMSVFSRTRRLRNLHRVSAARVQIVPRAQTRGTEGQGIASIRADDPEVGGKAGASQRGRTPVPLDALRTRAPCQAPLCGPWHGRRRVELIHQPADDRGEACLLRIVDTPFILNGPARVVAWPTELFHFRVSHARGIGKSRAQKNSQGVATKMSKQSHRARSFPSSSWGGANRMPSGPHKSGDALTDLDGAGRGSLQGAPPCRPKTPRRVGDAPVRPGR